LGDIENIKYSAKQSGAHDFIQKYSNKYNQVLSKAFSGGINPSTGQKQRIALARAFFRDSKLLILDEPTSSIDAKGEYEIFERLFDFAQDKSVVIISHRFSTVRNATRIVVLDEGKITEEGSHEELIKIPDGRYKTAFDIQKKGYE
jgi:ATP-binding cassette subfamily B protein